MEQISSYPAYKESGVPWLGQIPAHWRIIPGLAAYRLNQQKNTGQVETTVLSLSYGRIVIKPSEKLYGLVPASFETYQIVEPEDIIIRPTDLQNDRTSLRVGQAKDRGIITSAYLCLRPTELLCADYAYYVLDAYDLMKVFYGMGSGLRQNLDFTDLRRMPVLLPPKSEQDAIARYLDHVDRQIRRFIRAKRRTIELLNEQKQAIIHQAVTRGLDPTVPLKPSGIEWLGDVPAHWEVMALRFRYSSELGKMLDAKRIVGNMLVPYVRNVDVQWDHVNTKDLAEMDIAPHEYPRYTLAVGDLLVCEGGEVGRCAIWSGEIEVCGFQKAIHRVRTLDTSRDSTRFLYYVMYTAAKKSVFRAEGSENTFAHLTGVKLRRHRFAYPPKAEQDAIVAYLDDAVSDIEAAISQIRCEIDLIREYRTRLIADVVTGKLDVRAAAHQLPAVVDEADLWDDEPSAEAEHLAEVEEAFPDDDN